MGQHAGKALASYKQNSPWRRAIAWLWQLASMSKDRLHVGHRNTRPSKWSSNTVGMEAGSCGSAAAPAVTSSVDAFTATAPVLPDCVLCVCLRRSSLWLWLWLLLRLLLL